MLNSSIEHATNRDGVREHKRYQIEGDDGVESYVGAYVDEGQGNREEGGKCDCVDRYTKFWVDV